MNHQTTQKFWALYNNLPKPIQELADSNFALLKQGSRHPSLHLKEVDRFWSVRVGMRYRALAVRHEEALIWFWIGTHAEYDRIVRGR